MSKLVKILLTPTPTQGDRTVRMRAKAREQPLGGLGVSICALEMLRSLSILLVEKRGRKDAVLEGGVIFHDVALEAADAFEPLKSVLGAISISYRNYQVRLSSPARTIH